MSKSLVAPLKKSILRLELMGCQLLSCLTTETERALRIKPNKRFWCNSTTALPWIRSSSAEFKPFVSARVAEIQESQPKDIWQYISSEENPADALTRGIEPEELQAWHHGPAFMKQPESEWPDFESAMVKTPKLHQSDPEKNNKATSKVSKALQPMHHDANEILSPEPEAVTAENIDNLATGAITVTFEKFQDEQRVVSGLIAETREDTKDVLDRILARSSSFHKARRVTASTVRAIENILRKKGIKGPISIAEIQDAEKRLIKMVQTGVGIIIHKQVQELDPFLDDDGRWKARGWLESVRDLPQEM